MMKVAIDSGPLLSGHKVRGIGVYTRELVKALEEKSRSTKNFTVKAVDFVGTDLSKFDVVHYQVFHPHILTLPLRKPAKKVVVTMHDLIPLIYPDKYPPGVRGKINFVKQKRRLKYVDAILAVSETSKKDICRLLKINPSKVFVVHEAPRSVFRRLDNKKTLEEVLKKYNLPKEFFLYVGDINYNKNIPLLFEAVKKSGKNLVVAGKQAKEIDNAGLGLENLNGPMDWVRYLFGVAHPENAHYDELLELVKGNEKIYRLGFVPDEDLVVLYNMAKAYIQPSLYEGFGLPILEAIECGTPVIASKINAHKEIAGDAAIYFDPKNVSELTKLLKGNVGATGDLPKKYTWEKTATETYQVYKSI